MTNSTLASAFWKNVIECGQQPALSLRQRPAVRTLTWFELAAVVNKWVQWLQCERIEPGCCLATWLPNGLDWIAIDLACQTWGVVHVAIDRREPEGRMLQLAEYSQAVLVIRQNEMDLADLPRVEFEPRAMADQANRVHPSGAAQMLATSGTSGNPKLVMLSHENLLGNALAKLEAAPQRSSDLRLNILPFAHAYARTCELSTWILSRSQLAIAGDWQEWLEMAGQLQPTLANLVPYLVERAAEALRDDPAVLGRGMRLLQVGGAGLSDEVWEHFAALGLPPLQGYGLTEASPVVCSNRSGQQRVGNMGPAVRGAKLHIDDEGVLWTRGPHVMLGYWRDPQATQAAIVDGWLCTGDIVQQQPQGLKVLGRKSHQIVLSSGYKVAPEDVESRLLAHPWVEQVVVSGVGQAHLTACIWPRWEAMPADLFECSELPPASRSNGTRPGTEHLRLQAWEQAMAAAAAELLADLPRYAHPRRFGLLEQALSIQAGTLTIKVAPRRGMPLATRQTAG